MKQPFTANEIRSAKAKLRNNRSAGYDNVSAEYIKYPPEEVDELIAEILNIAAETDDVPNELVQGILCAIQKPGKTVGPPEHLRPIILLSMLSSEHLRVFSEGDTPKGGVIFFAPSREWVNNFWRGQKLFAYYTVKKSL